MFLSRKIKIQEEILKLLNVFIKNTEIKSANAKCFLAKSLQPSE
jgi:hypothetical protein